jgi:hypothetical protein
MCTLHRRTEPSDVGGEHGLLPCSHAAGFPGGQAKHGLKHARLRDQRTGGRECQKHCFYAVRTPQALLVDKQNMPTMHTALVLCK